jgi:2-keto-3-deoxy-L-rhamnonate aldolase RhmA
MIADFRKRLKKKDTLIGTIVSVPSPAIAEILSDAGFDWLFIDGEHGALEIGDIVGILQAVGHRTPCIVRVPSAQEVFIKKVLDLGSAGIIAPQVNTAGEAADVVRWSRYAPSGSRGVGLARAHGYGFGFKDYLQSANDRVTVIVQVESALAVQNIDEISKVEGIDAILLGPYDLSASFGKMGLIDDPVVVDAIGKVTQSCLSAGIPLGYFGVTAEAIQPYIDRGYTLIAGGVDTLFLGSAARKMLSELRPKH